MVSHLLRPPALMGGTRSSGRSHRRASAQVVCRAASSASARGRPSTYTPPSARPQSPRLDADFAKRSAQLRELLQETLSLAVSSGPKGFMRGLQAAEAVAGIAREYLAAGGRADPPQVVLRKLFERLGATYIKLGQFIASSPSVFPEEYVLEFQKCLDRTDPVPFDTIKRIAEAELGAPLEQVYSYVDPKPLASASVAQVHAAVLRSSGKEVVIKVLKPGTEDVLVTDLNVVYLFSRYMELLQPELQRLSLGSILSDIRTSMIDECDFTKEAYHLTQFSEFLDRRGYRSAATCPYVYCQHSSKRLLTMERLTGVPLTDLASIRAITSRDPESVLVAALNTWFASVLGCETFHADVHAGNLLVLPDGRVGFIDFGIVGRISPVTWAAMETLVTSLATANYEKMARALATIGACDTDVDFGAFGRDLESFFAELETVNAGVVLSTSNGPSGSRGVSASLDVDQAQVNRLLLELVRIGETHGIRFPREFGLFIKQLLYFDRYTRILAPQMQIFSDDRISWRDVTATINAM